MDVKILKYLNKMIQYEEAGHVDAAFILADKMIETFPENTLDILLEKAKMEFRTGNEKEALLDFIKVYELSDSAEIYDLIIEAYFEIYEKVYMENYENNIRIMEQYPYYRNQYGTEEIAVLPLWKDDQICIYADDQVKSFQVCERTDEIQLQENEIVFISNELWISKIRMCEEDSRQKQQLVLNRCLPLYLYYDQSYWTLFCQLFDLSILTKLHRIVFLIGTKCLHDYFMESMVQYPDRYLYCGMQDDKELILKYKYFLEQKSGECKKEAERYYKCNAEQIVSNIKSRKAKILFLASRYTSVLQYHTRDCMEAAARLGYDTRLLIEPEDLRRMRMVDLYSMLADFKPDICFNIDHFRTEHIQNFYEMIWITWVQDFLPQSTLNKEIVESLTDRDIVISCFISDLNARQFGMNYRDVLRAPISCNNMLYKNWVLSEEEHKQYDCDICIVANETDYDQYINEYTEKISETERQNFLDIIKVYFELMEQEYFFYGFKSNFQLIGHIANQLGILWSANTIKGISEDIYYSIFYRRYKSLVAEWLIDSGYTSLKLYGNQWQTNEKFRPYAMGTIENGEKLSKALGASKISIGEHPHVSLPSKAIESISSGTLYIAHHIPEEFDMANAREYFKENEELVYYYSKQDLLEKIDYYLKNDEERKRIIKAGQKRVAAELTYEKMMERILKEAAELIERREEG